MRITPDVSETNKFNVCTFDNNGLVYWTLYALLGLGELHICLFRSRFNEDLVA